MAIAELKPRQDLSQKQRAKGAMKPTPALPDLCRDIRQTQRQRVCNLRSRIMLDNRLCATIATARGYHAGMEEAERKQRRAEAAAVVARVKAGEGLQEDEKFEAFILATAVGNDAFQVMVKGYEKDMEREAKKLHIADWMTQPDQLGFGWLSLAIIIGECGDLNNYSNPSKVWKRMGCAPIESRGHVRMGATWRGAKPSLSAEEWEDAGYSPRRRSCMYVIGDTLQKGNRGGPYSRRYSEAKAAAIELHPEWTVCSKCKGTGKAKNGNKCSGKCKSGVVTMHPHLHALLLMEKRLLRNLWIEWTDGGNDCVEESSQPYT